MTEPVQKPEESVAVQQEVTPAQGDAIAPQGLAGRAGNWAFGHKDFFQGTAGSVMFRNALRTLVAIAPYSVVNVAAQHFFHRTVAGPASSKHDFSGLVSHTLRNKVFQNSVVIGLSFTTFRTVSKVWNKNYDRIFGAKSAAEAIKAVRDMPANIIRDARDITPVEVSATGLAAVTLAAVRWGLNPEPAALKEIAGKKGYFNWQKGYWKDWLANATGYSVFFEVNDRLYNSFAKSRAERRGKEIASVSSTQDDQHTTRFSMDSVPRVLFRNAASVFMAAMPYIAVQRMMNKGEGLLACKWPEGGAPAGAKTYMKNLGAWLMGFEIPFAIFTSGMELYTRAYDKLIGALEDKYRKEKVRPEKTENYAAMVDKSRVGAKLARAM